MAVLEMGGRALLLDAGLSFPRDAIDGVVLTHGHEDHVGALPYLLREIDLDVYATALTLALLGPKLEEHGVVDRVRTHTIEAGGSADIGPFGARFHRVTHSIPDGVAVGAEHPFGILLPTGDFRLDPTP